MAFQDKLSTSDVKRICAPDGAEPGGLWIEGPDGLALQLVVAEKCSPSRKSMREYPPEVSSCGRAPSRAQVQAVRPTHLSHVLLFTADVDATRSFTRTFWVCGCRTIRVRLSLSCTVHTAAITICSPSPNRRESACIIRVGMSRLWIGCAGQRPDGSRRFRGRLGTGAPCSRLELFPLRTRPVGQLCGIFIRYRLHRCRHVLASGRSSA